MQQRKSLFTEKITLLKRVFSSSFHHFLLHSFFALPRSNITLFIEGGLKTGRYVNGNRRTSSKVSECGWRGASEWEGISPYKVGGLQYKKRLFKNAFEGNDMSTKQKRKSIKCRIYEFSFSFSLASKSCIISIPLQVCLAKAAKANCISDVHNSYLNADHSVSLFIRIWMPMMCNKKSINKRNNRAE